MARVYVGGLDPRVTERELEDVFVKFGVLRSVWVARKPPGFAFIEFDDTRDADDAIRDLDGKNGWRVEMSRARDGPRGGGRGRDEESKCYECGEYGHFARECRNRRGGGGRGRSRSPGYRRSSYRSPSPYSRRRSPSYDRRSPSYDRYERRRSPSYDRYERRRSPSYDRYDRGRRYSRSPSR